jgi:L-threonylcarbamoyladenylate synthase
LVVYPTDTIYGLGCDPFDPDAVDRLFKAKARGYKPIPILCSDLKKVRGIVSLGSRALTIARREWPGALTIIAPAVRMVPFRVDQGSGEVGVRVPNMDDCRRLVRLCGGYLAGTSANVSGSPPCQTAREAQLTLGDRVNLILDGGHSSRASSTVIRVNGDVLEIVRRGPVRIQDRIERNPRPREALTQSFKSVRNRGLGRHL